MIADLARAISGEVIGPGDPGYDAARALFMGGVDPRPAAIVRPADAREVARVLAYVRGSGMALAVRSGGHSGAAHGSVDGGVVVDLRSLRTIEIDPAGRTAWAGAGLTAIEYTRAAGEHGLATGFGDTGSVGIGGITLGGGIGYLVRKFGLTVDSLLAAEVVTADGQILMVDAETQPDLFWAIRGGGGNFGIVTRFRFRLQQVPAVYGGMLILPATAETVAGFIAAAEAAPEELTTIANVMGAPPLPMIPAERHGTLVNLALMTYAGEAAAAERAVAPFRALATPLADLMRPMTYPEVYPPDDESYHPKAAARTMFVDRIDGAVARAILEHLEEARDAPVRVAQLRVLGGAMARIPVEATAFAHRASRIMVNLAAFWETSAERAEREAWVERFMGALRQGDQGAYVNFLGDEGPARVRAAYPGRTWDRLRAAKARYDPTNLFRRNHNIPPAGVELGGTVRTSSR